MSKDQQHASFAPGAIDAAHDATNPDDCLVCESKPDGSLDVNVGWLRTHGLYSFKFRIPKCVCDDGKGGSDHVLPVSHSEAGQFASAPHLVEVQPCPNQPSQCVVACQFQAPTHEGEYEHLLLFRFDSCHGRLYRANLRAHCLARKQGTPALRAGVHALKHHHVGDDSSSVTTEGF